MHGKHFMLIAPLLPSQTFVSANFLSPTSSAGTWAATWGPGDKCWCVSRVWPRWPVAGSHQTAHQRRICPRCQFCPCGHLLRLCAPEQHTGGSIHTCKHTWKQHLQQPSVSVMSLVASEQIWFGSKIKMPVMILDTGLRVLFHNFVSAGHRLLIRWGLQFIFEKQRWLLLVSISLALCYLHFETITGEWVLLLVNCHNKVLASSFCSVIQTKCTNSTVHTVFVLIHTLLGWVFILVHIIDPAH